MPAPIVLQLLFQSFALAQSATQPKQMQVSQLAEKAPALVFPDMAQQSRNQKAFDKGQDEEGMRK